MNSSQGKRCLDSRQFVPKGIPVEGMSCHGLKGAQVRNKEDGIFYAHFTDIFVILGGLGLDIFCSNCLDGVSGVCNVQLIQFSFRITCI